MRLAPFRLHRPASGEEATAIFDELGPDALAYCGGTELLLIAKLGLADFTDLVDVKPIDELGGIEADAAGLRIGATVTHRALERSAVVRERWPSLAKMERAVANLRVRNVGTIGGNLCFADPHSDPATWLLAAGGEVSVRRGGAPARRLAIEDFVRGPYETALKDGELLLCVHVPAPAPASAIVHRKMSFQERPAITVAVNVELENDRVRTARIAIGSVGVRPVRPPDAEAALVGLDALAPDEDAIARSADAAASECEPVADANGSVEYKRQLVRVLSARCAREAMAGAVAQR